MCIRISYTLIKSGITISKTDGATSSGADGKWYLYRVDDVMKLLMRNIKPTPICSNQNKYLEDFKGKKGIIIFSSCNWDDATGHIDLFDGSKVEGQAYSMCGNVRLYEIP